MGEGERDPPGATPAPGTPAPLTLVQAVQTHHTVAGSFFPLPRGLADAVPLEVKAQGEAGDRRMGRCGQSSSGCHPQARQGEPGLGGEGAKGTRSSRLENQMGEQLGTQRFPG